MKKTVHRVIKSKPSVADELLGKFKDEPAKEKTITEIIRGIKEKWIQKILIKIKI